MRCLTSLLVCVSDWAGAALCGAGDWKVSGDRRRGRIDTTQGRQEKNVFMKLAKGVMSLYDVTSYLSDVLSYSRLLALGLATGVIAQGGQYHGAVGWYEFYRNRGVCADFNRGPYV